MCEDLDVTSKLVLIVSLVIEMSVTSSGLAPTLTVTEGALIGHIGLRNLFNCYKLTQSLVEQQPTYQ